MNLRATSGGKKARFNFSLTEVDLGCALHKLNYKAFSYF